MKIEITDHITVLFFRRDCSRSRNWHAQTSDDHRVLASVDENGAVVDAALLEVCQCRAQCSAGSVANQHAPYDDDNDDDDDDDDVDS